MKTRKDKVTLFANKKKINLRVNARIKVQLVIGFIIPIIFVILVGMVSYQKAEEGMCTNYEESAISSLDMVMDYFDFGFGLVSSDLLQFTLDSDISKYSVGVFSGDPLQENTILNKTRSNMVIKESTNLFIESMLFIPKDCADIISTNDLKGKGFYGEWEQSEEAKSILQSSKAINIIGKHSALDEITGTNPDQYALSYIGIMNNKSACMVVDISKEAIEQRMRDLNLGSGSVVAYITQDKREIMVTGTDDESKEQGKTLDIVFTEQDFYLENVKSKSMNGLEYVSYKGTEFLYMYKKSEKSGGMICALVPKTSVIKKAKEINKITSLLVVLSCIIAAIVASLIFMSIGNGMTKITKKLATASKGDLTVDMDTKGKSEFAILAKNIMQMITSMKTLITKVENSVKLVSNSALQVGDASEVINEYSTHITYAIEEIDKGIGQQAEDLHSCLFQMDSLSKKIQIINSEVISVGELADTTKKMIGQSIDTMGGLSKQSASTTQITSKVKLNIQELEKKSAVIESFVDVINSISVQTNLLSLNASIEAARAGIAGRGFAVVSEEIRKLADESREAANEIQKVVQEIKKQTHETVVTANHAENIVGEQAITVQRTIEVFQNINHCTEDLLVNLNEISISVKNVDAERGITLEAFESISAISEETAVSTNVVNETAVLQMRSVETLKLAAEDLKQNMNELEQTLQMFKTC